MDKLLDQFQERLEKHFAALNGARKGTGFPIFVFEHGLDEQERLKLNSLLRQHLRDSGDIGKHWLLWSIYATEQGYSYTGHEYWQSFRDNTPHWDNSDSWRLKSWFRRFSKDYDSVVPTGLWAGHFNRISWPITHAILPKYLQNQFARALWDLSHHIARAPTFEASAIGRIFSHYAHGSNRFHEFLQQEELTGRIVLALLGQQTQGGIDPIDPKTLQRIVYDLEQVRQQKEWLREARRVVQDRFFGIGKGSAPSSLHYIEQGEHRYKPEPSIKPSIVLRSKGTGQWAAIIDVPDFRPVADNADIRNFLNTTRVRLAGVSGLRPAGWMIGARRQAVLEQWPTSGVALIDFESSHGVVSNLISSRCMMSAGPSWLFRIGADGLAREILGRIVRPGGSYLLVARHELARDSAWISKVHLACEGVMAWRAEVPGAMSQEDNAVLHAINIQVAKTIRVWPSGLPARAWDGEGSSEWLTTESPCLGLLHDYPIEAYSIRLNGGEETVIEAGVVGYPTFVQLPQLSAGTHHFSVCARKDRYSADRLETPEAEGHLVLNVRAPNPWQPGRSFHNGLVVSTDPVSLDLDTVLENRFDLSVLGPDNIQIRCELSLKHGNGEEFFSQQVGEPLTLPVTSFTWNKHFHRFLQNHTDKFLEAAAGCLTVKTDELGDYIIPFERNLLPVRLLLKQRPEAVFAKLVDDTGSEDREPEIGFSRFDRPLYMNKIPADELRTGKDFWAPGGLLSASLDQFKDSVLISASAQGGGLSGLAPDSKFPELDERDLDWRVMFDAIENWRAARLAGVLLPVRRDRVVEAFKSAVLQRVCGHGWIKAEEHFMARPNDHSALEGLKRNVDQITSFATVLIRDRLHMDGDFEEAVKWFGGLASRYLQITPALSRNALCFAADPCRFADHVGPSLNALINEMIATPAIIRAARLSALLSANPPGSPEKHYYPRWGW